MALDSGWANFFVGLGILSQQKICRERLLLLCKQNILSAENIISRQNFLSGQIKSSRQNNLSASKIISYRNKKFRRFKFCQTCFGRQSAQ